jgi:hypothetical protein
VRLRIVRAFGPDDATMVVAMVRYNGVIHAQSTAKYYAYRSSTWHLRSSLSLVPSTGSDKS